MNLCVFQTCLKMPIKHIIGMNWRCFRLIKIRYLKTLNSILWRYKLIVYFRWRYDWKLCGTQIAKTWFPILFNETNVKNGFLDEQKSLRQGSCGAISPFLNALTTFLRLFHISKKHWCWKNILQYDANTYHLNKKKYDAQTYRQ